MEWYLETSLHVQSYRIRIKPVGHMDSILFSKFETRIPGQLAFPSDLVVSIFKSQADFCRNGCFHLNSSSFTEETRGSANNRIDVEGEDMLVVKKEKIKKH